MTGTDFVDALREARPDDLSLRRNMTDTDLIAALRADAARLRRTEMSDELFAIRTMAEDITEAEDADLPGLVRTLKTHVDNYCSLEEKCS